MSDLGRHPRSGGWGIGPLGGQHHADELPLPVGSSTSWYRRRRIEGLKEYMGQMQEGFTIILTLAAGPDFK